MTTGKSTGYLPHNPRLHSWSSRLLLRADFVELDFSCELYPLDQSLNGSGKLYSLLITYCIHMEQSLEKVPQKVDLLLALLQSGSQIGGLV